jgi:hypothetical protein
MTITAAGELNSTTDDTTGTVSHTTASFTPPDDSLLVAHCYCINGTGGGDVQTGMTLSGGGLTWTKRAGPNGGTAASYTSCHEVWTAPVVTGASMTMTYSHAGNVGADKSSAHIQVHSFITDGGGSCGFDGAPNLISEPNNGDDGPQSLALPSAAASASYKTASRAYSSDGSDPLAIHGTGWTEVYDVTHGGYGSLQSQAITADANTDVDWDDIAAGGPQTAWNSSGIGIEVEEIAGGSNTTIAVPLGPLR